MGVKFYQILLERNFGYFVVNLPRESIKRSGVWKMLLSEYQSKNIASCLLLSRYVQLSSAIQSALFSLRHERFSAERLIRKPAERSESSRQDFPFFLPSNNDIWMCSCILSSWENEIPLNKWFALDRGFFQSSKTIARATACWSHRCEGNILGKLARNFSTFFRVSRRELF